MKRFWLAYALCWGICVVLFNLAVFLPPAGFAQAARESGVLGTAYAFIMAAFVLHLACALFAFGKTWKTVFYRLPLIASGCGTLAALLAAGLACALMPWMPLWLCVLLCAVILGVHIIGIIRAAAAAGAVQDVEQRAAARTGVFAGLTARAEQIRSLASTPKTKELAQKAYELLRYSDPVSSPELARDEELIAVSLEDFARRTSAGDDDGASAACQELERQIRIRNSKCKTHK